MVPLPEKRHRVYWGFFYRIACGLLKVDTETATVYWRPSTKCEWKERVPSFRTSPGMTDYGYWFIRISFVYFVRNRRKIYRRKIALHRLVWLVHNQRETIPLGCDIHHIDKDTHNNHHSNLTALDIPSNRKNDSSFTPVEDF